MTVVCKATYALRNGPCELVGTPDAPQAADMYWQDGAPRSVRLPTDLAPFKRRVDVMVVGHAWAPHGQAVASLVARLVVGPLDKAIAVHGDRFWMPDGRLSEPAPFTRMPLRWMRAAGGPRSWNPVGIAPSVDVTTPAPPPNFEPLGFVLRSPTQEIPPVGFGPIAPRWPSRVEHLLAHRSAWSHEAWHEQPLPAGVDASYFNAAPTDQQITELPAQAQLLLEHLHPELPRMIAVIEDVRPRAMVTRSGGNPQEVWLRADTLLVDADRGVCSVTWRAAVPLRHPKEEGIVVVAPTRGIPAPMPERPPPARTVPIPPSIEASTPKPAAALPFAPTPFQRTPTRQIPVSSLQPAAAPVLPFVAAGAIAPDDDGTETLVPRAEARAPSVLPFRPPSALPFRAPEPVVEEEPEPETERKPVIQPDAALPFAKPSAAASPLFVLSAPGSVVPSTGAVVPLAGAVVPLAGAVVPLAGDVVPSEGAVVPLAGAMVPSAGAVVPLSGDVVPLAGAMVPSAGAMVPSAGAMVPLAGDTVPLAGDTVPLAGDVVPSPGELSIERYARIKVDLWGARAALHEVLARYGVDEVAWRVHERQQAEALAGEAREGRCDLALALCAAFEAAKAPGVAPPPLGGLA
nr:DUF2169 domain-containing protein [Polyangium spumosum]